MECQKLKKKLELRGVEDTGKRLAHGCFYACDKEVSYKGLTCLSRAVQLKQPGDGTTEAEDSAAGARSEYHFQHNYDSHCTQLLELRHPHLLQFFGVWYDEEKQPSLVMELLPQCLSEVLESYGALPEEISYSILRDVALGMVYLHSLSPTPVVHGELIASNIYLTTDMSAKVADMGISNVLDLTPARRKAIGYKALVHLPPESLTLPSNERPPSRSAQEALSKKLDSYSYGVLMIHTLSARFPEYIAKRAHRYCGVVLDPSTEDMSNDVDELLEGVRTGHPLSSLILQCIHRLPDLRPAFASIFTSISDMMLQFPVPTIARRLEILRRLIKSPSSPMNPDFIKCLARKDSITTMANSLEIEHLKLQIEELQVENKGLRTSLTKQRDIVNARDQEMAAKLMAKDQEIIAKYQELSAQEAMVETYRATIAAKEGTLSVITNQMQHLQEYIANKHEVCGLFASTCLKYVNSVSVLPACDWCPPSSRVCSNPHADNSHSWVVMPLYAFAVWSRPD